MVNIGEGKRLKFFIFRLPQLRSQALAADSGEPRAPDPQNQGEQSTEHHLQPLMKNIGFITARHTDVHDIRHQKRDDQFKYDSETTQNTVRMPYFL